MGPQCRSEASDSGLRVHRFYRFIGLWGLQGL